MLVLGKNDDSDKRKDKMVYDGAADVKLESGQSINGKNDDAEILSQQNSTQPSLKPLFSKNNSTDKPPRKKSGKQIGAPGYGRSWDPTVTEAAVHCFVKNYTVCNQRLEIANRKRNSGGFITRILGTRRRNDLARKIKNAVVNDDYVEFELTLNECEELIGELSYEANHNRKKHVSDQACEIAESLESQWYDAKRA